MEQAPRFSTQNYQTYPSLRTKPGQHPVPLTYHKNEPITTVYSFTPPPNLFVKRFSFGEQKRLTIHFKSLSLSVF